MKDELRRILFVHKCVGCRQILDEKSFDDAFCKECKKRYLSAKMDICPECSLPAEDCDCCPVMLKKDKVLSLRKLFFYKTDRASDPQNRLIYFLKRRRSRRVARAVALDLAKLIGSELDKILSEERVALLSVPRSRGAVSRYGFDQSVLICRELAKLSGIEYLEALKRRRGGKTQKKLTAGERRKNIKDLIYASGVTENTFEGKIVILFDDVVTTGASMSACVHILRELSVKKIICLAIASDLKS